MFGTWWEKSHCAESKDCWSWQESAQGCSEFCSLWDLTGELTVEEQCVLSVVVPPESLIYPDLVSHNPCVSLYLTEPTVPGSRFLTRTMTSLLSVPGSHVAVPASTVLGALL